MFWKMFKIILTVIIFPMIIYLLSWTYHRTHAALLSDEGRWLKDLENFEEGLLKKHVNPNWASSTAAFKVRSKIDSIKKAIKKKEGAIDFDKMRIALMQASAFLQDGHTHIANYSDDVGDFPFRVKWYKDGLYIIAADKQLQYLLGYKIIAVNNQPLKKVLKKIYTICPSPNESSLKMYSELYITKPGLLYGLDISESNRKATFHFENFEGQNKKVEICGYSEKQQWLTIRDMPHYISPLYEKNASKPYWYEYFNDNKLLYMKYNRVVNNSVAPMDNFVQRMMTLVDSVQVDKFIIDIRNNRGGDAFLTTKLVMEIQKRPKINKRGVLYAIINYRTFSAAVSFAGNLLSKTNVTFVGTEMGDYNNMPGDAKFFDLHMNRMTWQASELFWENTYYDDLKNTFSPSFVYETSFNEEFEGKTPIIDFVLMDTLIANNQSWRQPANTNKYLNERYRFSPDKTLTLDLDKGRLKISGFIEASLTHINDSTFEAKNLRFHLTLSNDQVLLIKKDSSSRSLPRLKKNEFTALELVQLKKYEEARNAYLSLYEIHGDGLHGISANNLSVMSSYLYHGTQDNRMQMELLKIALEMHPKSMMPLGRMSTSKKIAGKKISAAWYRARALWYFDWKNLDNYGKSFGFL